MRVEENEYLIVYPGHNLSALLYQRLLKRGCKTEIVATPIKISYGCSQSIKFKERDFNLVLEESKKMNVLSRGIYRIIKVGKTETYKKEF